MGCIVFLIIFSQESPILPAKVCHTTSPAFVTKTELLKRIPFDSEIGDPQLLMLEWFIRLQEQKPNNIPPTDNTQQENESYESESEDDENVQPFWQDAADESESEKGANDAEEDESDGPSEAGTGSFFFAQTTDVGAKLTPKPQQAKLKI